VLSEKETEEEEEESYYCFRRLLPLGSSFGQTNKQAKASRKQQMTSPERIKTPALIVCSSRTSRTLLPPLVYLFASTPISENI